MRYLEELQERANEQAEQLFNQAVVERVEFIKKNIDEVMFGTSGASGGVLLSHNLPEIVDVSAVNKEAVRQVNEQLGWQCVVLAGNVARPDFTRLRKFLHPSVR